jgi:hypothetical protein
LNFNGFWATGEKGTIQVVLFLLTLGATLTISIYPPLGAMTATISFMGIAILIGYAYRTARLTKKEIMASVGLATLIGAIVLLWLIFLQFFIH